MKKLIPIALLLFILTVSLAGCNNSGGPIDSGSNNPAPNSSVPNNPASYERGALTTAGFESRYLDIRFTAPAGFIMATEDDMNSMMDFGADVMGMDGALVDYAKLNTVYEMMASAPVGSPNVILMTEKLPLSNITEDQYLDVVKTQLNDVSAMAEYEFSGGTESVEIAGQSYKLLIAEAAIFGEFMTQKYMIRKMGDRMVCLVTTSTPDTEEDLNALLAGFEKY